MKRIVVAALLVGTLVLGFGGVAGVACAPSARRSPLQDVQGLLDGLARARNTTYTAAYATGDGGAVVVAQAPPRYAYQGAGAAYLLSPDVAYLCRATECQPSPGADAVSPTQARAISAALGGGFLPVEAVAALMSAAAARPGARATRAERTVAGGPAECVAVSTGPGQGLLACVNPAGILVFFASKAVRMELRRFTAAVAPDAFDLPNT